MNADEDLVFGFGKRRVVFEDLVQAVVMTDGPVVLDHPLLLETKDFLELESLGQGTVVVLLFERNLGEFFVEIAAKTVGEQLVGALAGRDAAQGQLLDEAVLVGPVGAFDAALGLSRQMHLARRVNRRFCA